MLSLNNCARLLKKRKRVGRGGSRGGTSGKGNKGQKARTSGKVRPLFEGGQTSLARRLPKRGFTNAPFAQDWVVVNIGDLNAIFDDGAEVTRAALVERGLVKGARKARLKILGHGKLQKKLVIHADACSGAAIVRIRSQGGEVHITKEG